MKYRIKQVGDWYYPQVKRFGLFWMNFELNENYHELGAAQSAIQSEILRTQKQKTVIIHEYEGE